jgi:hypothetical protein
LLASSCTSQLCTLKHLSETRFKIPLPQANIQLWWVRIYICVQLDKVQCVPLAGSPGKCWFTKRTKVQYICISYL